MPEAMAAAAEAKRVAHSRWVGWLGRAGFAAQGTCFVIIAVLALELAFGSKGKLTDPRGALVVLAEGGWTRVLLVLLAVGFGGYSVWRFAQAIFDRGGMGSDAGGLGRRAIQFAQGVLYALLTLSAVRVLTGTRPQGSAKKAASGILGWPAGAVLVGAIGVALAIVAVVNIYWGVSRRFMESLGNYRRHALAEPLLNVVGMVGFCALGFVLGVVSWFLLKAAVDFNAGKVVSLGGALARLARANYGGVLLTAVAVGLLAYGLFGLLQTKYHDV